MKRIRILALVSLVFSVGAAAYGATATFSTAAPTLGTNDQANLTGHVTTGSNANQTKSNVGGAGANTTYLADDQMIQGQTFKTGSNSNGYQLTAVTLRQVTYNTFSLVPDINYTVRVTSPAGNTLTVLGQETAFVAASEPNNFPTISGGNNAGAGSGNYVTFTFDVPVVLNPNTTYGFDVGGGNFPTYYWETDGRSCTPGGGGACNPLDPYPNGTAYSSGSAGSGS